MSVAIMLAETSTLEALLRGDSAAAHAHARELLALPEIFAEDSLPVTRLESWVRAAQYTRGRFAEMLVPLTPEALLAEVASEEPAPSDEFFYLPTETAAWFPDRVVPAPYYVSLLADHAKLEDGRHLPSALLEFAVSGLLHEVLADLPMPLPTIDHLEVPPAWSMVPALTGTATIGGVSMPSHILAPEVEPEVAWQSDQGPFLRSVADVLSPQLARMEDDISAGILIGWCLRAFEAPAVDDYLLRQVLRQGVLFSDALRALC